MKLSNDAVTDPFNQAKIRKIAISGHEIILKKFYKSYTKSFKYYIDYTK